MEWRDDVNPLDRNVQGIREWLRPDQLDKKVVIDNCPSWQPLVDELCSFAVSRLGKTNNNWLRIVPLVMHEMSADISDQVFNSEDIEIRIEGEPWQTTMWDSLEFDEVKEEVNPLMSFNDDEMAREAVAKRMKDIYMARELADPFYNDDKKDDDVDKDVPYHDPDVII